MKTTILRVGMLLVSNMMVVIPLARNDVERPALCHAPRKFQNCLRMEDVSQINQFRSIATGLCETFFPSSIHSVINPKETMPVTPGTTSMTMAEFAQGVNPKNYKRQSNSSEVIPRKRHSPNDSSKEGDEDQGLLPVSMSSMEYL